MSYSRPNNDHAYITPTESFNNEPLDDSTQTALSNEENVVSLDESAAFAACPNQAGNYYTTQNTDIPIEVFANNPIQQDPSLINQLPIDSTSQNKKNMVFVDESQSFSTYPNANNSRSNNDNVYITPTEESFNNMPLNDSTQTAPSNNVQNRPSQDMQSNKNKSRRRTNERTLYQDTKKNILYFQPETNESLGRAAKALLQYFKSKGIGKGLLAYRPPCKAIFVATSDQTIHENIKKYFKVEHIDEVSEEFYNTFDHILSAPKLPVNKRSLYRDLNRNILYFIPEIDESLATARTILSKHLQDQGIGKSLLSYHSEYKAIFVITSDQTIYEKIKENFKGEHFDTKPPEEFYNTFNKILRKSRLRPNERTLYQDIKKNILYFQPEINESLGGAQSTLLKYFKSKGIGKGLLAYRPPCKAIFVATSDQTIHENIKKHFKVEHINEMSEEFYHTFYKIQQESPDQKWHYFSIQNNALPTQALIHNDIQQYPSLINNTQQTSQNTSPITSTMANNDFDISNPPVNENSIDMNALSSNSITLFGNNGTATKKRTPEDNSNADAPASFAPYINHDSTQTQTTLSKNVQNRDVNIRPLYQSEVNMTPEELATFQQSKARKRRHRISKKVFTNYDAQPNPSSINMTQIYSTPQSESNIVYADAPASFAPYINQEGNNYSIQNHAIPTLAFSNYDIQQYPSLINNTQHTNQNIFPITTSMASTNLDFSNPPVNENSIYMTALNSNSITLFGNNKNVPKKRTAPEDNSHNPTLKSARNK